jgi:L-ascorbate metabolism protein UlaG (beta-lactamase superfamily)
LLTRLRPGRPDLGRHAQRFTVPAAGSDAALMTDGFFCRPRLARVDGSLARAGVKRLEAVVPVHTHFDHALDSALVADRTGAKLVGGESAANVGRGHGLDESRLVVADSGRPIRLGTFDITLVGSRHSPPDRFPGTIDQPVVPPVKAAAYRCGETWSTFVQHRPSDRRLLIQGSAGFVKGALAGRRADVVYLGVGQLGVQPQSYVLDYWTETVRSVGARRVVLVHWDDFFRPLSKPLRALPYVADNLDCSLGVLSGLAERDGVALDLPTVWRREDPWGRI